MNIDLQNFIIEHENDDVHNLVLQSARYPNIDMPFAIKQINGRQKIKSKIPSFYNNIELLYPVQLSLEQSSSELTAIYKSNLCEGKSFIDLTGGFGIDCYFISRKYSQTTYIERNADLCDIVKHNFEQLHADNIIVYNMQSEEFLNKIQFVDLIYIDPARRDNIGKKVVQLSDCEPNVIDLIDILRLKTNQIIIKLSPMLDIKKALVDLPQTNEVHVISVENECKEILLLINNIDKIDTRIKTVNITRKNEYQFFDFEIQEEESANPVFAETIQTYLYEPNSAIMKSGAFKLIAERMDIFKLHINTHLYTSNIYIEDFPGRTFTIEKTFGSTKSDIKELCKNITKANISTRNYPLSVEEFRKKTKIKDGGDVYLFACKILTNQNIILQCRKV